MYEIHSSIVKTRKRVPCDFKTKTVICKLLLLLLSLPITIHITLVAAITNCFQLK